MARINFVELPAGPIDATRRFYAEAFGCEFESFGPSYASTMSDAVDIGLQGDAGEATAAPLPVIEVEDLDATLASVEAGGGTVTRPIFSYPGGRRFQFRDPAGNELAASVSGED